MINAIGANYDMIDPVFTTPLSGKQPEVVVETFLALYIKNIFLDPISKQNIDEDGPKNLQFAMIQSVINQEVAKQIVQENTFLRSQFKELNERQDPGQK